MIDDDAETITCFCNDKLLDERVSAGIKDSNITWGRRLERDDTGAHFLSAAYV